MKYIAFGLITIFLVSCAGGVKQSTPTFSPPPTSTETPVATLPPINTSESTLPNYALPVWMSNPSTNILAVIITDDSTDSPRISFYNAATGEKYDIAISENAKGYFWYDNAHFGFLINDLKSLEIIDMNTGKTSEKVLQPESLRLWDLEHENYSIGGREIVALEIVHDNGGNGMLLEQTGSYWNTKSKSRLFNAEWGIEQRDTITVTNTRNKETVWTLKLPENTYGTDFAWSPTDENWLAFIQGEPVPHNDFDMTAVKLTIVDVVSKKILWAYDDDFGEIRWSPDGKKILFENGSAAPCILFIETGLKLCLRNIPRLVPPGFVLGTAARYTWGTDVESIFYIYLYLPLSKKEDEITGNLCIYSLKDGNIRCPTQNLPVLHGNSIVYYDISPDQQFIHFCYSDSTILNDYAGNSSDAIIHINGTGFFSWVGNSANIPPSCSNESLWRPLP